MQIHEICSIFPPMSDEEFAALKADIAEHGQREPIRTYRGEVIDGRNRLRACEELGIEPKVEEWDGVGSLVDLVVSLNLHRRHLTSGQLAMCAREAKDRLARGIAEEERRRKRQVQSEIERQKRDAAAPGVPDQDPDPSCEIVPKSDASPTRIKKAPRDAKREAAALYGTNPHYIADADLIYEHDPALAERVKAGAITLPQARLEVARAKKRAELEAKAAAVGTGVT